VPTRYTLISGIGTALILFTVPLSFTFENVSIPFIQLLMRGDILLIAPLVDIVFGRKVRWWSWAALALLSWSGIGSQASELEWGFVSVWTDPVILPLFGIGATLTVISVLSIVILLDARENAYCVPLERAASLVAGVGGAVLLAWFFGGRMPRPAELAGAAILIAAIVLLSVAPRLSARRTRISLSDAPAASAPEI
jgi:hypothetical protein